MTEAAKVPAHPGCRISRVRPKDSHLAEVVRLPSSVDRDRIALMRRVRRALDGHTKNMGIGGFAFVIWDANGDRTAVSRTWDAGPRIDEVPDFVRAALRTYFIDERAAAVAAAQLGLPPPDESA